MLTRKALRYTTWDPPTTLRRLPDLGAHRETIYTERQAWRVETPKRFGRSINRSTIHILLYAYNVQHVSTHEPKLTGQKSNPLGPLYHLLPLNDPIPRDLPILTPPSPQYPPLAPTLRIPFHDYYTPDSQ